MLRVRLVGGLRTELGGVAVAAPEGRRARALLAWLALHPGMHPRARLAVRFWPGVRDASARASLRSAVWGLRVALGPGADGCLRSTRDEVGLVPEAVETDVAELSRLLADGRVEEAVDRHGGELLPDMEEDWVHDARDEHRALLAGALASLASRSERSGDLAGAVVWARRRAALEPLAEGPQREVMRLLADAGDRPAALAAYGRLRDRLDEQIGALPSAETRRLAAAVRRGDARTAEGPPGGRDGAGVPTSARPPPLVGRRAPLAELRAAWDRARCGTGVAVAIRGEAGVGKTRLTLELAAAATADGGRVATCAALELGGPAPFGMWGELLREACRGVEPPPPGARWPAELARLVPDVEARLGRVPERPAWTPPDLERARLFQAAVEAVEWAAAERPLLLVLEDVHDADVASLALTGYVGRRVPHLPVMLVLTRRDVPRRPEADALEHALRARGALAAEVALGPLSRSETAALLGLAMPCPAAALERAVAAAEGNPLFALEVARALARGESGVPASLRGAARAAAHGLPAAACRLVELVAVAGRRLDRAEVDALAVEGVDDAAAAGVERGLLDAAGGRIGFRHALIRDAVYEDLPEPRRASLHQAVAVAMTTAGAGDDPGRDAEVARHLRLAGRGTPPRPPAARRTSR